MKRIMIHCAVGMIALALFTETVDAAQGDVDENNLSSTIIAMEKAALTRWNHGDPSGYLEICADGITYFDPGSPARVDGYPVLKKLYDPLTGKLHSDRFELLNPKVQLYGKTGILTYNLITYSGGKVTSRWNSTEVYAKMDGSWKIVHSHWSVTKHEKPKTTEDAGKDTIKKAVLEANQRMNNAGTDVDQFFSHIPDFNDGMIIQNGVLFKTRQDAYDTITSGFQGITEVKRVYDQTHVRVLSPTLALLTGTGTTRVTLEDGRTLQSPFAVSMVYQCIDGQWNVLQGHYSLPNRR